MKVDMSSIPRPVRTFPPTVLALCIIGAGTLWPGHGHAAPPGASASAATPSAAVTVTDSELSPLPKLEAIRRVEASTDAAKELESLLGRLVSEKLDIREAARKELDKPMPELAPAVHARVQQIRESLDRKKAPNVIGDARKAARKERKEQKKAGKQSDDDESGDWLAIVMADAHPKDQTWREIVELLAMVRVLSGAATMPALRDLIELRANFNELLRIDLLRQLDKLKEKAVPALLEATKHDAANVRSFAREKLDKLGKVTPGEAVSTTDPEVLADTLRAFGHIREVEAVDVLLSFANHDRKKVRDAAREAITAIGEPGRWRLRDAYQDLIGEKVDKSVPWDLLARRIFAIYDKSRVAELWGLYSSGVDAAKAGKSGQAVEAFDKVLARDPLFDRRSEMAAAYFAEAKTIPFEEAERRLAMLRKARRLAPESADARAKVDIDVDKVDAEIAFTEAKVLIKEGRPERYLLTRATELDPSHVEAKELLASFEEKASPKPQAAVPRYTLAGGIGAGALLLIGFVAFFRRKKSSPNASPQKPKAGAVTPAPGPMNEKPAPAFPAPPAEQTERNDKPAE